MLDEKVYSQIELENDIRKLGVEPGDDLVVHVSLRSIGKVDGGYTTFMEALLCVVSPGGTIITPSFNYQSLDPEGNTNPPCDDVELARKQVKAFDVENSPSQEGSFGDIVRLHTKGARSNHPCIAWSAIGDRAIEFTEDVSIDDADGLNSPLGRVYTRGHGKVMLLGVDHSKNTAVHLADAMAKSRHYLLEKITYKDIDGVWKTFFGCGGCSHGFNKVKYHLDMTKYETAGEIGDAACSLIEMKPFIDDLRPIFEKTPWAFLCQGRECGECDKWRKMYGV